MRSVFISITLSLFALILVLPFGSIVMGAFQNGWGAFFDSLQRPESIHALWVSLTIVVFVTILNTIMGILFALEIVRGSWIAKCLRPLMNTVVDLPFAVLLLLAV